MTKALRLLDVFRSEGPVLGLSDLARHAGVAKSTAFRLLALLQEAELIERDGRNYRLSWRMFELGACVQGVGSGSMRSLAGPWLTEGFVRAGGGVVHLAVLDGCDVLVLDAVSGPRSPRTSTPIGSRVPAASVAAGRAMLAVSPSGNVRSRLARLPEALSDGLMDELRATRARGVAIGAESGGEVLAVAAPVMCSSQPVAAVSIAVASARADLPSLSEIVKWVARRISLEVDEYGATPGNAAATKIDNRQRR